jgi:thioredoxin 1
MKDKVTIEAFNEFIKGSSAPLCILDFHAPWCGPCKMLAPILDELVSERGVDLLKINIDESVELSNHFKVRSVPTLFFIKDTKIADSVIGQLSKRSLDAKIKDLL